MGIVTERVEGKVGTAAERECCLVLNLELAYAVVDIEPGIGYVPRRMPHDAIVPRIVKFYSPAHIVLSTVDVDRVSLIERVAQSECEPIGVHATDDVIHPLIVSVRVGIHPRSRTVVKSGKSLCLKFLARVHKVV